MPSDRDVIFHYSIFEHHMLGYGNNDSNLNVLHPLHGIQTIELPFLVFLRFDKFALRNTLYSSCAIVKNLQSINKLVYVRETLLNAEAIILIILNNLINGNEKITALINPSNLLDVKK